MENKVQQRANIGELMPRKCKIGIVPMDLEEKSKQAKD